MRRRARPRRARGRWQYLCAPSAPLSPALRNTPEYEARAYETRIKDGGCLIAVHTPSCEYVDIVRQVSKDNDLDDFSAVSEEK